MPKPKMRRSFFFVFHYLFRVTQYLGSGELSADSDPENTKTSEAVEAAKTGIKMWFCFQKIWSVGYPPR